MHNLVEVVVRLLNDCTVLSAVLNNSSGLTSDSFTLVLTAGVFHLSIVIYKAMEEQMIDSLLVVLASVFDMLKVA